MNGAVKTNGQGIFEFGNHQHQKEYPKDRVLVVPKGEELVHPVNLHAKLSKGARIDKEIEDEEREEAEEKDKKNEAKKHEENRKFGERRQSKSSFD